MTSSNNKIIQKAHSFHSESRNHINNLKQNSKEFNSSKVINGFLLQSRRQLSGFDLNTKDKYFKYSLNKFQSIGGLRNSISFGSNTTNMALPGVNINVSISKIDNSSQKNKMFHYKDKNALL